MEENHKLEIEELEERTFMLGSQITSTTHRKTKESLMAEKSAINLKIDHLRILQDAENEEQYSEKHHTLIIENREFIFFSVNGERIFINPKGEVEFKYAPCGHKKHMPISDLRLHQHENNRIKFETWRRLLKENMVYNGAMKCEQCLKDKEKMFQQFRRHGTRPISKVSWELRALR